MPVCRQRIFVSAEDPAGEAPSECVGELRLERVSFRYPARPDVMVMKDFSLEVKAGEPGCVTMLTVAICVWNGGRLGSAQGTAGASACKDNKVPALLCCGYTRAHNIVVQGIPQSAGLSRRRQCLDSRPSRSFSVQCNGTSSTAGTPV